jgi:HTH-type transcriptional regulator/antitoxin MqsA
MKCPCCGRADLVHEVRDIRFEDSGLSMVIPHVEGDYCPSCGEVLLDALNGDRYSELAAAFEERVRENRLARRAQVS